MLTASSAAAAIAIGLLCALGACRVSSAGLRRRTSSRAWADAPNRGLTWLAVPWLVLPPLILLAASLIQPVYFSRYLTYCLPAVALLAGAGLAALRLPARAGVLALVVALVMPAQLAYRAPGGGAEAIAQFLGAHAQRGDAIVYREPSVPPLYLAYPADFSRLRDLSEAQTPAQADRLYGNTVAVPVLLQRERGVDRIWMLLGTWNPASLLAPGFRLAHQWRVGGQLVQLYTRSG